MKPQTSLYLSFVLLLGLMMSPLPAGISGDEEYVYVDPSGRIIRLPKKPFYTAAKPGPWKAEDAVAHKPEVTFRMRTEGLENIRILQVKATHPIEKDNQITDIYVLDKDDIVVGYYHFPPGITEYKGEIWINSVINYLQVYVDCGKHGMWRNEVRF